MLIENPDAFKAWLTSVLEPLCDADPEALAKYVYALVRKDRPIEALREGMVEQLDVFLQKETKPFVELLFKTLEKQEYLQQPATPIPNTNPPNPNIPPVITKPDVPEVTTTKEVKPIIPVSSLPDLTLETVNGTAAVTTTTVKKDFVRENDTPVPHRKEREHKKSESEKDEKAPATVRPGRLRHRSNSRNRSRSRSWDRSRRSRSRDRSRERERRDRSRPWRNKSPPRRYERRRSRSNSPVIPRNRSPRHSYRGRYRNRSPPRSHSRSRSRSLDKDKKDHKEPLSGAGTPTQDSNHGDTDMRLISSTQSIQSVVANADVNSGSGNFVPNNTGPVFHGKRRCRDFDEKGYCMRGDMCPYDHGNDPVVLENTTLGTVLAFGPNGQPPLEGPPANEMLAPPMIRPNSAHVMHGHHLPHRPMHPGIPPEYNPSAPSMWNRSGFRGGPISGPPRPGMFHGPGLPLLGGPQQGLNAPPGPHNLVQRELISVPVLDNSSQHMNDVMYPRTADYMSLQENMGMKKKPGFDFNRLGPRTKNPVNCSLELKKVPRELNNITHLNNHFSKFGKIVNIQVNYEGDPEAALITFSSHTEAYAAHRSTEAVLNNRFIKVFWHSNGDGKQENVPPRSVKERLGGQQVTNVSSNTHKVLNMVQPKANTTGTGTTPTTTAQSDGNSNSNEEENTDKNNMVVNNTAKSLYFIPSAKKEMLADNRAQQNAAIKKSQEILAFKEQVKKKQEERRKEAAQLTQDLIKRKQELLDKQLTQQKVLLDKLEKVGPQGPQRETIKEAIQKLQQSIEDTRKSLVAAVKQRSVTQVSVAAKISQQRKSKDEAQKELLDAELDLITKQQEGADTSDLQKKVFELKKHAQQLGIPLNSRRGSMPPLRISRGFKFIRGSRSSHSFANASVDHRPTKLLVSGYEIEEKTDVLAHFAQYGEISDYVSDDSTPSVVLNFKTRKEAELAMLKGKHFQDRTLSVTWCTNVQLSNQLSTNRRDSRAVLLSESDDDHLLDSIPEDELNAEGVDLSEEALLQDDEEEEEENEEDRSWRR
ncbi:RNA-binding protein 26 [Chrysoperla carnea]|uniref:RNA-binding protein 26 n=1 Tax=Chrysoperla carnea TaxID=189513 RepID=UPI001D0878BC|nr:RNA-binding protein 26 [Chrysoperla carnea]